MSVPTTKCRAKFYISGLTLYPGQDAGGSVQLQAATRGTRNAEWSRATPSGQITMSVNNPAGFRWFEDLMAESRATGRHAEVYVDFGVCPDGHAGDGHAFVPGTGEEGTSYGPAYCFECGYGKDQEIGTWNPETRQLEDTRPSHPNG